MSLLSKTQYFVFIKKYIYFIKYIIFKKEKFQVFEVLFLANPTLSSARVTKISKLVKIKA